MTPTPPATLDQAGIAARIPHSGSMCLLDRLEAWSAQDIRCAASSHRSADHPLRMGGVLHSACAIEYAAQAMALHGALTAAATAAGAADAADAPPAAGFLASVRSVRLMVPRLDNVETELTISAQRLAGDTRQAMYSFALHDAHGALLVEGRATVILNTSP